MGIFNKQRKELPPLLSDTEIDGASYDQVIDFLVSVNKSDFDKIIKVANLHRKANAEVAKVTGMEYQEPQSIFDLQTIEAMAIKEPDTEAGDFLTDDDELNAAFMDDEPSQKIPVKTNRAKGKK